MKTFLMIAAAALALGVARPSLAEEAAAKDEQLTVINFEDDTISGDLQRPDGSLVEARKRVEHTNLIRTRESFRDQVLESVGDL